MLHFSIVVPNFNSGATLERALESLVRQEYPKLSIIVADSESTDGSREIIERYRPRLDTVIIRKDNGQADGINGGFAAAKGDVFGWLCADDELCLGTLAHVNEVYDRRPETEVVVGACERIYADGTTFITRVGPDAWSKITVQNVIDQPSVFWRADLHRRLGTLDTGFHLAFDWDLWCRMQRLGARLTTTDRILSRFYFSETNKTSSAGSLFVKEAYVVMRRYGPLGGRIADIYRFLYRHFDLYGCFDRPQTCSRARGVAFMVAMGTLMVLIGRRLLFMYNWHFASCQQRQLKWW